MLGVTKVRNYIPARAYNYELVLRGLEPLVVTSAQAPFWAFEGFTIPTGNSQKHFPGTYSVGDFVFEAVENELGLVCQFFFDWQNQVKDPDGYYQMPSYYKKNVIVKLVNTLKVAYTNLTYVGCWPKSVTPLNLDSASGSTPLKISITLSVDDVKKSGLSLSSIAVQSAL